MGKKTRGPEQVTSWADPEKNIPDRNSQRVWDQIKTIPYDKNQDREVTVTLQDGQVLTGFLTAKFEAIKEDNQIGLIDDGLKTTFIATSKIDTIVSAVKENK